MNNGEYIKTLEEQKKWLDEQEKENLFKLRQQLFIIRMTLNDSQYEKFIADLRLKLKDTPGMLRILDENLI